MLSTPDTNRTREILETIAMDILGKLPRKSLVDHERSGMITPIDAVDNLNVRTKHRNKDQNKQGKEEQ